MCFDDAERVMLNHPQVSNGYRDPYAVQRTLGPGLYSGFRLSTAPVG